MPFDGTTRLSNSTLHDYLAREGITPVSTVLLADHKADQLRRHRASFIGSGAFFALIMLTASGGMASQFYLRPELGIDTAGILFLSSLFALTAGMITWMLLATAATFGLQLYGKPRWIEQPLPYGFRDCPAPIRKVVQHVENTRPYGTRLSIGILVRDHVVLDPYVILTFDNQEACLGIWDGDEIVACAQID